MMSTIRHKSRFLTVLLIANMAVLTVAASAQDKKASAPGSAQAGKPKMPEMESEFFNDFTNQVKSGDRIQIRRTLRKASEMSPYPTAMVVINAMSDYPEMPQEFREFAAALSKGWTKEYAEFAPAMIVIFSIKDRKFGVTKDSKVSQSISDSLKKAIAGGRVTSELAKNNIGRAMRLAADVVADTVPTSRTRSKTGVAKRTAAPTGTRQAPTRRVATPPPTRKPRRRGFKFGWIIGIIVIVICISLVSSLFRGARRGYGGGMGGGYFGGGGGGGFMGGMLTGGLLGYMFGGGSRGWGGGHDHHDSGLGGYVDDNHGGSDWGGGGGDDWGGGGGGFDSFDGGGFDGGGSFGEW